MRFLLYLYVFLFSSLIYNRLYLAAVLSLVLIPIAILINRYIKNQRVKDYKDKIENAKKAFTKHKHIEPFLNVNKEPWTIIELVPGVTRVRAKIFANLVKKTKAANFEEFANICNIEPAFQPIARMIVKF